MLLSIFFLLFLVSSLLSISLGAEYRINNVNDFISFSNAVKSGTNYSGTTVFLDSDIDFSVEHSGTFTQIGMYSSNSFLGVFDGQGHTISNLVLKSAYQPTGLFGISNGLTIQNVVIDDSCSFVSSFKSSSYGAFVGGIIGRCYSSTESCTIKNNVNMASVTFNGNVTSSVLIGGIIGNLYSSTYSNFIKNCVNYGSVTHSGTSGSWVEMGGIAGLNQGRSSSFIYIRNCLNYGKLSHNVTSSTPSIGGIVGYGWYTIFDNCVNSGEISSNKASKYIGIIVGYITTYTEITHCYWNEVIKYKIIGTMTPSTAVLMNNHFFNPESFELDEPAIIGDKKCTSLIDALNAAADYYTLRDYSHWLFNKDGNAASFAIDGTKLNLTLTSQIILLPSLASSGSSVFDGWYKDSRYLTPLVDYITAGSDMTLYGKTEENTNSYTITFDTRGGTPVSSITEKFGTIVAISSGTTRDYCDFLGWETEYGDSVSNEFTVPEHNTILYASWLCTRITTPEELISFSNAVNGGANFLGTTVFLDSDIDFTGEYSEKFVPIGHNTTCYFNGTFNGQGHIINNLTIKTASQRAGLFGYSAGSTILNVVIGGSCSFVNKYNYESENPHAGGIFGQCSSKYGPCTIENSVNMGSISFDGNATKGLFVGGFVGYFFSQSYKVAIKNCVNYGSLTHSGIGSSFTYIGGITAISNGVASHYAYIQNCLNYGTLINSGVSKTLYIGGIIGLSYYSIFDNCINSGEIYSSKESTYIGSIVGKISAYTEIIHCYWTNCTGYNKAYGYNASEVVVTNSSLVSLNKITQNELNEYANQNSWSQWIMLHLNGGKVNSIPYDALIVTQKHFPDPVRENNTFLFWSKEYECTTQYDPKASGISGITDLYAGWNISIVTFDFNNGTTTNKTINFKETIVYPKNNVREGYTFNGWDNKPEIMPGRDLTITALWTINNYTLKFIFNNGTEAEVRILNYSQKIEYPADPEKEGYTFDKWDNKPATMPADDTTITALWIPNKYIITYSANGGNQPSQSAKEVTYDEEYGKLPTAEREGYTFTGWFTEEESGTKIESATKVTNAEHHTLYAHWDINNYTLKFVFNNGTEAEVRILNYSQKIEYPANLERTGYTFDKWDNKFDTMPANDTIITALWTANNYTVTFNATGGDVTPLSKEVTYNSVYGVLPTPTRVGYGFNGWFTEENGKGTKVTESTTVKITSNQTLYANWTAGTVTVTFNATGGISTQASKSVVYDGEYGELPEAGKEGYTFAGWFTEEEGGHNVEEITRVTNAEHHTLYAHWTINNYTLIFVFDNETEPAVRILNYSQKIEYPADSERVGYTFDRWDKEIDKMPANDTIITALWTINNYTLKIIFNNGTEPEMKTLNYSQKIEYPVDPEKTGYTFDKWDNKPDTMPANDTTITALWTINNYTLKFIFNNGTEPEMKTLNYSQEIDYPVDPEKTGYTFDKWDNKPDTMPANDTTITALWTANNYTITFNATGGDVTPLSKEVTYDSVYGVLPTPTRVGYGFNGWFTEEDGKGDEVTESTTVKITSNQTLYANWTAGAITVTFNATGGISIQTSKSVVYDGEYGELPEAEKEGYTFAGWFTEEEGGSRIEETTIVNNPRHHTLYAHWTINNYTLTFIFGNEVDPEVIILNYSQKIEYPVDPERVGYTFDGWDIKHANMPANDTTITALWTINNYTLTFIFDNGTEPEVRILNYSQEVEYPSNPEREGYTFDGWNNKPDTMLANDTTITALWTINNYTIKFIFNNGAEAEIRILNYSQKIEYPANPEREGYTFDGWNNAPEYMPANDTTITALWTINNYTLTFIFNNGDKPEVRILNYSQKIEYPANLEKEGYTFDGWDNKPVTMPANDTIITALWTVNNYTITFNATGGDVTPLSKEVTYDSVYGVLPTPTRIGYGFNGWFTEENGKGTKVTESTTVKITSNQTLYANWTAGAVTVTFNATGGISTQASKSVVYDGEYGELPAAERGGYTFSGWFTEEDDGNIVEKITIVTNAEHHTLYAHWTINNYTLTFIFGNEVDPEVIILNYSQKIEYPVDPEKTGYTLDKWDKEIDEMPANDTIITALWTANNYTITFNATGGDVTSLSKEVTYDSVYGVLPTPTRVGYGFNGWFTEENGKGNEIKESTTVKITSNQTLYANWTAGALTVTFNATGGISSQTSKFVVYDGEYGELPVAEKEGYTFAGWFTEEEGGSIIENITRVTNSGHHALYAHWTINNYTLKFIFDNGTEPETRILNYSQIIEYPANPEKEGYSFDKWDNKPAAIPANDTTITALWTINNYTLTIVFDNGTDPEVRILNFSQKIDYPANPEKEGYTFYEWDNKPVAMPANDTTITALWDINNYTLTFVFNIGDEPEVRILNYSQKIDYPADPEREGYTFDGWDNKFDAMPANDTIITALWTANNYTITFNATGGDVTPLSREVTYGSVYGVLPTPTRVGYGFNGWFTEEDGKGDEVTESTIFKITNNQTLYANWTAGALTVTFNATGGISIQTSKSVVYDGEYGELPVAEKEGYTFAGWFTEEESGTKIESATRVINAEHHTLYAHWDINNYTLKFIFDNGSESEVRILNYSQKIDYPANPEKEGYTFDKWDREIDKMPANDITITALWDINNYTLTFVFNNGTEPEVRILDYSQKIDYPADPEREGYSFDEWDREINKMPANDTTIIALWAINNYTLKFIFNNGTEPETRILNYSQKIDYPVDPEREGYTFYEWDREINTMSANDTTITALWTINNYTLTFIFNNGIEPEVRILNYSQEIECPANLEKEGYTFDGWDNKPVTMPANDTIITALWTVNNYTVTFNATGGDVTPLSKEVTYDSVYGVLPTPTKTGYAFNGWFTEENGKGTKVTESTTVKITRNQTLYANWTAGAVTVTFNATGGISTKTTLIVIYDREYGDLPSAERVGYSFAGWYTKEKDGDKVNNNTRVNNKYDHILYAHWTANKYKIAFISNNGSACSPIIQDCDSIIELPKPTRTGYTFECWCIDFGLTTRYTKTTMTAENITLYARWVINKYTVIFNFDNSDQNEARIFNFSQTIEYPEDPKKEGHTFNKWDKNVTEIPASNLTITALWFVNSYEITFNFDNGNDPEIIPFKFDQKIKYPDNPEKEGYTFIEWDDKIEYMPAYDLNITALWSINSYELTYDFNNKTRIKKTVVYNDTIEYPENVVFEGYEFKGWKPKPETMPASNLTVKAQWVEVTQFVEITFSSVDLTEIEVIEIVKQYTDNEFVIDRFEYDSSTGNVRVIIKFVDTEEANEFVRTVVEIIKHASETYFRDVAIVRKVLDSYSRKRCPFITFLVLFSF